MADTTYNGWSNRPTWNVNLWLSNDQGLYNEVNRIARTCAPDQYTAEEERESEVERFTQALEAYCRAIWPTGKTPDNDSLDACDFAEVAASWLED